MLIKVDADMTKSDRQEIQKAPVTRIIEIGVIICKNDEFIIVSYMFGWFPES